MAEYVTSSEVDSYVADRPDSTAWTGASSADKEDALKYASKIVDSLLFVGKKYETDISTQPLQWPRLIKTRQGWRIADLDGDGNAIIPWAVKYAVCEEILARLSTVNSKRRQLQAGGVKSFKISEISETFDGSFKGGGVMGTPLWSWTAYRLLEPYLAVGARSR
ncbi:MAG: DnaT-like ssDNA-binding protein [Methanothrix sp.]|jgi:hypothetical protein